MVTGCSQHRCLVLEHDPGRARPDIGLDNRCSRTEGIRIDRRPDCLEPGMRAAWPPEREVGEERLDQLGHPVRHRPRQDSRIGGIEAGHDHRIVGVGTGLETPRVDNRKWPYGPKPDRACGRSEKVAAGHRRTKHVRLLTSKYISITVVEMETSLPMIKFPRHLQCGDPVVQDAGTKRPGHDNGVGALRCYCVRWMCLRLRTRPASFARRGTISRASRSSTEETRTSGTPWTVSRLARGARSL